MTNTASILARLGKSERDNQTRANALRERVDNIASMVAIFDDRDRDSAPPERGWTAGEHASYGESARWERDTADRKLEKLLSR